jgi:hypothetical protein
MTDTIEVLTLHDTRGRPLRLARFESQDSTTGIPQLDAVKSAGKRKPSTARLMRMAKQEGVQVEITPDGSIIATPVNADHQETIASDLDKWVAKHAH